MKNFQIKKEIPIWLILAIPFMYLIIFWNQLPEQMPIHWNLQGEADDYGAKLLMPLMALGIYLLFLILPLIDPRKKNYELFSGTYYIIRLIIAAFFTFIFVVTAENERGADISVVNAVLVGILFLFIIFGNYIRRVRSNWFIGVRTPWTLENEEVWRKTHELAGKLMFWGGILGILLFFLIKDVLLQWILLPLLLIIVFVPVVYSYIIFQRLKKDQKNNGY